MSYGELLLLEALRVCQNLSQNQEQDACGPQLVPRERFVNVNTRLSTTYGTVTAGMSLISIVLYSVVCTGYSQGAESIHDDE